MSINDPELHTTNVNPAELPDHVERVDEAFDKTSLPQARAEGLEHPVATEPAKKKRRGLIIGASAVVATGLAGLITATSLMTGMKPSGEADNKNLPPAPVSKATSQASTVETAKAPRTWQEELTAALDARPKTGQHIAVGNRPVTAADAKAWLDADNTCLLSGAVKFSNQSNNSKFIVSLLANGQDGRLNATRHSLKTDENWATCAGGLYASADTDAFSSSRDLNLSIIDNQMARRTITRNPSEEPKVTIIDNSTVKVLVHGHSVTIQEDGKVLDDTAYADGGTLKLQNGNLVWVGPY